ncbi:MAG: hypothetical protein LLG01_03170 [Planctomycetaceae bacterium]|nr:hypothetical protein [Planctomycetaceae bacterium]
MDTQKAADELMVIRQLMERPIRYSTMSGLSGIWAGLVALGGLAVDDWICGRHGPRTAMWINLAVWAGVLLLAAGGVLVLTHIRERRQGMPAWSNVKKRIAMTILPCLAGGVGLTLVIIRIWYTHEGPNEWGLIPAIWMCFYGVALWQLGEFSPVEVRVLGAAFILGGLVSAGWLQVQPYWALGLSFGALHILYGIVVWIRYGG